MNSFELDGLDTAFIDVSHSESVDDIGRWKRTYRTIEATLKDIDEPETNEIILNKIASMINVLVRYGDATEDLVLEIAQLYIFSKEANIEPETFETSFGHKVVEAIKLLNQNLTSKASQESVFENRDFVFLYKVKLAEYISDLIMANYTDELIEEIDLIIKNFEGKTQKGLMKKLIEERAKV